MLSCRAPVKVANSMVWVAKCNGLSDLQIQRYCLCATKSPVLTLPLGALSLSHDARSGVVSDVCSEIFLNRAPGKSARLPAVRISITEEAK